MLRMGASGSELLNAEKLRARRVKGRAMEEEGEKGRRRRRRPRRERRRTARKGQSYSTGMRIPGQGTGAHCSTAPAGSQRRSPSLRCSPNVPGGATAQASPARKRASALWTLQQLAVPLLLQQWGPPGCSASTPTASISAHPLLLLLFLSFLPLLLLLGLPPSSSSPSRSGRPQTASPPSERAAPATLRLECSEAGRQQPLAARPLGLGVPARPPAELRVSRRPRGAMIYYTAVPASGASSAGRPLRDARGPAPAPDAAPDTNTGPRALPSLNRTPGRHTPPLPARAAPRLAAPSLLVGAPPPPRSPPAWPPPSCSPTASPPPPNASDWDTGK